MVLELHRFQMSLFFKGTRACAKDQGKGKRRETSGKSCFQNGGKCNSRRLCNIPKRVQASSFGIFRTENCMS